jgi:hypothetical protein
MLLSSKMTFYFAIICCHVQECESLPPFARYMYSDIRNAIPESLAVVYALHSLLLHYVMLIEGTICKTQSPMVSRQPRLLSPCATVARVWRTMSTAPTVAFKAFSTYNAFAFALHSNAAKIQHNLQRPITVFVP